ncbi:MAG: hypothetical protein ACW99G_17865 [Candidatus Thorarchaeota archaeon]|jgi:hypothetical protein
MLPGKIPARLQKEYNEKHVYHAFCIRTETSEVRGVNVNEEVLNEEIEKLKELYEDNIRTINVGEVLAIDEYTVSPIIPNNTSAMRHLVNNIWVSKEEIYNKEENK